MTKRIHWAWIVLSASFATIFIHYSIRLGYGILMPEMILSLGITKAQAGTIASSFYLAYSIFSPLMGFGVDRFSARILLAVFSCIVAAGTFFMGRPQTLSQACVSFFVVGMGASAMWTPVVTLVQRWFGVKRRGMALGILSVGYAIGYGAMGFALPLLVAGFGWRTCWFVLAGFALLLAPLNGIFLRNRPREMDLRPWGEAADSPQGGDQQEVQSRIPYRQMLKFPSLWFAGISYLFIGFTAYVVNIFTVTYATLELKFPFGQSAHLASAMALGGIGGALLLPIVSDFIGRKKTLMVINGCMTLSILLIILAGNRWPFLFSAVCMFGVFYAAVWPMYAAAAGDFFPLRATGSVLGFWTIFYGFALVLAPALGGYIADVTGTFTHSFATGVGTGVLATLFLLPIRKFREEAPKGGR
jgi:sugar phosphate permease